MLQQTQVARVLPYYAEFLRSFPTIRALGSASLSTVLIAWQGLGYNRRAQNLHRAAKALVKVRRFPRTPEVLEALPGVGHYTARALAAFAFNQDSVLLETNIRTAVLHHFFSSVPRKRNSTVYGTVSDTKILELLAHMLPKGRSREWHYALMDYGAHLKRSGVRLNAHSKGYVKQKSFKGSARQARGALLKELAQGSALQPRLLGLLGDDRRDQVRTQLRVLLGEGLIVRRGTRFSLPD
ncbi:MAG: A/G-specific adenine glycosylase [Minisyncoccia bacterium]